MVDNHLSSKIYVLGIMVSSHLTPRVEPETRVVIVNHKSQTNMHYVLYSPT